MSEWSETWLEGLDLKPATRANYVSNLNSRVLPAFGSTQLARITPAAVRTWQTRLRDEGLSAASIRQARQVLSAALDVAVADGLIIRNPAASVKPPKVRPRRQQFLTAEQVQTLAEACEDRQLGAGAVVFFLAWSGLRWGEAVALRWKKVDIERRRVEVKASATEVSGRLEWGSPKTHEERAVILPQFVIDRLGPPGPPDSLVFSAPRGGPLRNSNLRRGVWDPAVKVSGMPTDLVPHDLRYTAASLMIASGASIKAVQRALGHASAVMTLDTYGGLFEDDLRGPGRPDGRTLRVVALAGRSPGVGGSAPQVGQVVLYIGIVRPMRKTHATVQVAASLMEDPHGQHWGYELSKRSGIRSGALYPILHRMLAEGWLSDGWEELNESDRKRPPRRYYELTDLGRSNLGALLRQASQEARFRMVLGGQT